MVGGGLLPLPKRIIDIVHVEGVTALAIAIMLDSVYSGVRCIIFILSVRSTEGIKNRWLSWDNFSICEIYFQTRRFFTMPSFQ